MAGTIVDSSVWIDYWRGSATAETELLDQLLDQRGAETSDLILTELLTGIPDELEFRRTRRQMLALVCHEMVSRPLAVRAIDNHRALRRLGFTIRKPIDCLIATYCIETGAELLHSDRDFDPFEQHLGLRALRA